MAIYKDDKRGTWYFIIRIEGINGKVKQVKRRGFKTKKEAKLAEAELSLTPPTAEDMTFADLTDKYLKWYEKRRKESSIAKVDGIIRIHLLPYFANTKVSKITSGMVFDFQDLLMNKRSANTLLSIHTRLSAIFDFGIKHHGLNDNPAKRAGNFDVQVEKRMDFWELFEFKRFIKYVFELKYKVLFMTLYFSGLRKGELLALTWNDIDFKSKTIDVNKTDHNRIVTTPKTKASIRKLLMPQQVLDLLAELKKETKAKDTHNVFGEFNDSLSTTTLDNKFAAYVKASGVQKIRLHDFRHSHASYLINKGYNALMVAKRLGHSDVAMTLNTYSHLYPSSQEKAVEEMEQEIAL